MHEPAPTGAGSGTLYVVGRGPLVPAGLAAVALAAALGLSACDDTGSVPSRQSTELPSPEYPIPTSAYPPGAGTPSPTGEVAPVVATPPR
jgi:hypothetical protein